MEKFMTKEFAPGLALDTGEFISARDLNAQTAAQQVQTSTTNGSRTGDSEMTDNTQPEALRLADWLQAAVQIFPQRSEDGPVGYASEVDQIMDEAAAELRRLHAELETLRMGYAAARLEIESLRAAQPEVNLRCKSTQKRLAAQWGFVSSGAQQPGTAFENLRKALQFYADGGHFIRADQDAWDTVSGEPPNYWCDEAGTATVEDGSIAKLALSGHVIRFEDEDASTSREQATAQVAPQPSPAAQGDALDAARWRALLACGRIRIIGTAGVTGAGAHDPKALDPNKQPYGNYVHFGAEFWSTFPDQDYYNTKENPAYARATLTEFADAARAAQEGSKA